MKLTQGGVVAVVAAANAVIGTSNQKSQMKPKLK